MSDLDDKLQSLALAKARDLFFGYTTITQISRMTGVKMETLSKLAYGAGDHDKTTWRYERMMASNAEYTEISDRNRYLINDASARVANMVQQTISAREKLVDDKGKFIPLNSVELNRLVKTMFVAERLVERNNLPVAIPEPQLPTMKDVSPEPVAGALDMEKVIKAIQLDKSMQKRLGMMKEAPDDARQVQGAGLDDGSEGDRGVRERAPARTSQRPADDPIPRVGSDGDQEARVHREEPARADRDERAGAGDLEDEWSLGEGSLNDPLKDEYS